MRPALVAGILVIGLNFGPYINSSHNEMLFTVRPCEIYFESNAREISSSKCASGLAGHGAFERLPTGVLRRPGPLRGHVGAASAHTHTVTRPVGKLSVHILPLTPQFMSSVSFCQMPPLTRGKGR